MDIGTANLIAKTLTDEILEGAKDWLKDLARDVIELEEIEFWLEDCGKTEIVRKVNQHWDGGWNDFVETFP